jgi:hypothetical protein
LDRFKETTAALLDVWYLSQVQRTDLSISVQRYNMHESLSVPRLVAAEELLFAHDVQAILTLEERCRGAEGFEDVDIPVDAPVHTRAGKSVDDSLRAKARRIWPTFGVF